MKFWLKRLSVFFIAGIVYLVGQYFRGVWFLDSTIPNVCRKAMFGTHPFCNSPYVDSIGEPLIVLGQVLAVVGLILLVANERGWRAWLKFSYFYVPIATALTLWIFPFHFQMGLILDSIVPLSRGVLDFGGLYALITLGIVIVCRFKEMRNYRHIK